MAKRWDNSWGSPVVALRIPEPLNTAVRQYAYGEGKTVSGLIKELLEQRLTAAGVDWQTPAKPIEGQTTLDDVINA